MGVKLDLKKIALHARNAEYNPKRFAAVIMRIRCVAFFKSWIIFYHKSILGNWNQNTHVTFRSGSRGRRPLSSAPERWCALAPNLRRTAGICRNSGKFQKLPLDLVGPDFGCFSLDLSLYQESMQIADSSYIFCRLAARKYARIVQKLGFPTKFKDFKIQNMVSFLPDLEHDICSLITICPSLHTYLHRLALAMSSFLSGWRGLCWHTLRLKINDFKRSTLHHLLHRLWITFWITCWTS